MKNLIKSTRFHDCLKILTLITIATIATFFAYPVDATNVSEDPAYYEIKLSATPPNGGVLSGDGMYEEGAEIFIGAEASDGYYFSGWVENGEVISADSNLSITVNENLDLIALFDVHVTANDNNESDIELNYVSGEHSYTTLGPITSYSQYLQRLYGHGQGRITQYPSAGHMAIDSVNDGSRPYKVYALSGGVVQSIGTDSFGGRYIYIRVPALNDNRFLYLHFDSINPNLSVGQTIKTGHFLGIEGSTGYATGRHTHFAVIHPTNWQIELEPWYWLNRIPNDGGYPPPDSFNVWSSKSKYSTTENVVISWDTYPGTSSSPGYALRIDNTTTGQVVHNENHGTATSVNVGKLPAGNYSFYAVAWKNWTERLATSPTRTFTVRPPTGSVRVTIDPSEARSAGAQWRLTSGPDTGWKNSGTTISNIPTGSYTVTYKDITGWDKPANASVSVSSNQTTSRTGTYSIKNYTLYVRSTNPTSGVTITSSTGHGGTTGDNEYQISVAHGTSVNLTAPLYVGSGNSRTSFQRWDGTHPSNNRTISGIMDGGKLFRAIYVDDPETISDPTFTDVPTGHPFFIEIEALAESGITEGYDDNTFRPSSIVTRMAMAAFLVRGLELDQDYTVPAQPTFPDVTISHPFFDEIELLAASGISEGYDDGTFRPYSNVTRMAMAAFLSRALELDQDYVVPAQPTFPDVSSDHHFYEEIELLAASGIAEGYDDGTFRPSANVTRMAMASFLFRGLELE